jgi:hypothetical protein
MGTSLNVIDSVSPSREPLQEEVDYRLLFLHLPPGCGEFPGPGSVFDAAFVDLS